MIMKKKSNRITIICTEKQAFLIELSLDILSRMTAGQLDQIVRSIEIMRKKGFDIKDDWWNKHDEAIDNLKELLFPELHKNASYGVGRKELGDGQIAYEMVKCLQNYRSRNMKDAGVLSLTPLHYSKEPLIEIK